MLELLFLLLPIAGLYGFYMGYRSAKKDQDEQSNKLSKEYVTGVNLLLSNQQDKAVDLFLAMLQQQENENNIYGDSKFEASLTLGNLFSSRGEIDRAIRIQQSLIDDPNISFSQKCIAKQEIAMNYEKVGFLDRAETIYISLVDEPDFAEHALKRLAEIYQKTKEWKKAINIAEKCQKVFLNENNQALAHYYCEYAALLSPENNERKALLMSALTASPTCIRASIELANFYMLNNELDNAIREMESILDKNPYFLSEVLANLQWCYKQQQAQHHYELFLIRARQAHRSGLLELAMADLIEQKSGINTAKSHLYDQLSHIPSMDMFNRLIGYEAQQAETSEAKESLQRLQGLVVKKIESSHHYQCTHCGYRSYRLLWHCPSCNKWETLQPRDVLAITQH